VQKENAYGQLRLERMNKRMVGVRAKRGELAFPPEGSQAGFVSGVGMILVKSAE
jgi:hypothetical protein